ncbi:MAG: hypothetical protein JWR08_2376 [Enterovirga sp.]|nr:hypothetical protein [Enterovirga sp.]
MIRVVAAALAACVAAGCDTPNFRTAQFPFGRAQTLAATGNLRFVMERDRVLPHTTAHVVCSEPSPDFSTDTLTDFKTTVKVPTGSATADGELGLKTTETTHELAGRSKGVLALRDGLHAACQAYANGAIGKDAYSMILSQYGLLLVSLMRDDFYKDAAGARQVPATPAASAFAAVLVSCINNHDPTRRDYPEATSDRFHLNQLLDRARCREIVRRAGSGRLG